MAKDMRRRAWKMHHLSALNCPNNRHAVPDGDLTMSNPKNPEHDLPEDQAEDDEEDDKGPAGGRCPICEMLAGECDHLVASIDLTYSEFVAGAIFAQERVILDLLEHLVAVIPKLSRWRARGRYSSMSRPSSGPRRKKAPVPATRWLFITRNSWRR